MIAQTLDAVYEHGAFRLADAKPLDLLDGQRVRLVVESVEQAEAILELAASAYAGLSGEIEEGEAVTRNGDHAWAEPFIEWSEPDPAVERERDAFIAMHPMLKERYSDQYVAIHDGALIDQDHDYAALYARIDRAYPDEFVWLAAVMDEPLPTIHHRSPRLI